MAITTAITRRHRRSTLSITTILVVVDHRRCFGIAIATVDVGGAAVSNPQPGHSRVWCGLSINENHHHRLYPRDCSTTTTAISRRCVESSNNNRTPPPPIGWCGERVLTGTTATTGATAAIGRHQHGGAVRLQPSTAFVDLHRSGFDRLTSSSHATIAVAAKLGHAAVDCHLSGGDRLWCYAISAATPATVDCHQTGGCRFADLGYGATRSGGSVGFGHRSTTAHSSGGRRLVEWFGRLRPPFHHQSPSLRGW